MKSVSLAAAFTYEIFAIVGARPHNGAPYMYIPFRFVDIRICFR